MKKLFSAIVNSSLFGYTKRLAILCVFLSISVVAISNETTKYAKLTAKIHTKSTGSGCVYVYVKEGNTSSTKVCKQDEPSERSTSYKNTGDTYEFTFTLNAEADKGFYVAGWTNSSTSLESLQGGTTHTVKLNGTKTEGEVSETWYAVFKPIVALPEPNKVSIKVIGGESSPTMVKLPEVVKTNNLTLSITGDNEQNAWFQLSKDNNTYESSISFTSSASELSADGSKTDLPFYVKFVGTMDNATDYAKNVVIRVTAPTDAPDMFWDIPIEVTSEYDTYQFLRPQIVGVTNYEGIDFGSYTATLADPDNTLISIINSDSDPISLSTSGHYSVTLKATPSNSYKFYGWYKITFNEDGTEKNPVLISQSATYGPVDFKESAKIYPLYLRSDHALFRIKDDVSGKLYYDLQEALNIAAADKKNVVFNAPAKGTTGTLYPKAGGSAYTIPQGVTLLIPGDAAYTCRTKYDEVSDSDDFLADTVSSQYSHYSKLILANNTKITLQGGNICVYSTLCSAQPNNGSPIRYGWIEMGENCEIATTSGQQSYLYVLGYITGPKTSSIKLNGGSIAYEAFQLSDFRGGKALAPGIGLGVTSNDKGVFPSEQFYIQNIEVPMTIQSGATLRCMMAADVSIVGLQHTEIDLIAKSSGLIQLTSNVELIKYYDSERDVQVYHVIGKGANQSSAKLGNVSVDISLISMNTEDFVLPITSNMEIIFDNVTISSANRVGMLAGSKIWIKENAVLNQSAQFYVHDKVENRYVGTDGYPGYKGYFGSLNEELIPVRHTPNGTHRKRTVKDLASAQLRVDGQLNITVKGKGLYTTASGADIVSFKDGAQIKISESYKEAAKTEKLYRLRQNSNVEVQYPELSIEPAWLKNSNGQYVKTTGDAVTYEYYITGQDANGNPIGIWSLPPATVTADSWTGTLCTATMPTTPVDMTIQCKVENVGSDSYTNAFTAELSNTTNFAFDDTKFSFDAANSTLSIHVKYTPRDNTATAATSKLTLKNATIPTEEYTYTTTLTATEEYIPDFSVSESTIQVPTLEVLGNISTLNDAFTITPVSNNVAGMVDSRLVWTCELSNNNFGYTQGSLNSGEITGNKVTFTTSNPGDQSATLTIKATYTPSNGGEPKVCTKEITLTGTTNINNTLAYDMPDQILVTAESVPVQFTGKNNESSITITLVNEDDTKPAAKLINNGDGTYSINALNAGTFTLYASQETNGGVASVTNLSKQITVVKCTPEPVWNWGVVYGNQSYTLPFDPMTVVDGKWTLEENTDLVNALAYDENRHTIQVMNVGATTSAQFIFKQDETDIYNAFTQSYSVIINPDPRILPLEVDNKAKFDIIVSGEHSLGVDCDATGSITLPANGYVILQFIGIPGDLTFQLNDGADYNSILVAENTDKASDDTWQVITKSNSENKWLFTKINSSCVRLTNNSANTVTLSNLAITENSVYNRNTYYAKAEAIVSPAQAGQVAAKGNYLSVNSNNEKLFTTYSPFASTATAYSLAESEIVLINDKFAFSFQTQSTPGYYFSNWTSVGNTMITDEFSWSDMNHNYELSLNTTASDKSIAYSFDTYINLFCQQNQEICLAAKPESGEPNQQAVAYMNAGALALIPATNVGTWQANFALAEVESVEDVTWESNSPNSSDVVKEDVVFKVLGDDANDFEASINGNGFSFGENDIILSTINKTYTVNVSYTPQDIHGKHTATLTLSRVAIEGVDETSSKTATLTVTEDLTPSFTLSDAVFGSGALGQETILDIVPADKNKVAQVSDPAKIKWDAKLSDGEPFEILSVAADGTCRVRYFRTAQGNKSATLTLTATYTDSKGTEVSKSIDCNLSGSATADKTVNTLTLKQDIVVYVDDAPFSPFIVNDPNNTAPITITLPAGCSALVIEDGMLKPSGNFATGTYTIKVSQEANDYFQASGELTTKVTVKKHTPEVTWNLPQLYFGQTYDNPITTNSDGVLNITSSGVGASIIKINASTNTIEVDPLTEGEYDVIFTVSLAASNLFEAFTNTYNAIIYRDPRHLRVDVNSLAVYQAVTIASQTGANVSYSNDAIRFADIAGSEYTSRQWTMYFIGVPDQLVFTPSGNNAWQIQESPNGSNWDPTYASAKIPAGKQFSMSLRPNTRYVRISYASNSDSPSNGELNSFYITPLQGVKANVDALYLPISTDPNTPTTKSITIQYASTEELIVYTSDSQFTPNVYSLPALDEGVYAEQTIIVECEATVEKEAQLYIQNIEEGLFFELPLYAFVFPQELPIQLATDNAQRFNYLVTASNYVKWNMDARTITMQNAPSNTTRSFTFAFEGAPNIIRFNHTAADKGTWIIRERANNADDWYETDPTTRVINGSELEQGLLNTTRYVKVEYTSPYSEAVEISDLIIVGNASVITDVTKLELTDQQPTKEFTITAINLANFDVLIDNDNANFTANFDKSSLTATGVVNVPVSITWTPNVAIDNAILTIVNPNDANAVLATVELWGTKSAIDNPTNTGIYTGIAQKIKLNGSFEGYKRRLVDLTNAYDAATGTKALFDYLYIYGETSTMDGSTVITTPTTQRGSNAKTPCYIYKRVGDSYQLLKVVDNVNSSDKAISGAIVVPVNQDGVSTRIYITGFAPYASTGYTKHEEGVWLFRGEAGSKLDIYLEDCYIYSRYKTIDGHSFLNRENGESFSEGYARGSGGVLVFECSSLSNTTNPFDVTIHTCDSNLLKSHYGCFMSSIAGRAFQVSSPVQIHMMSADMSATTHLSFDDIWPTSNTRTITGDVVTAENLETIRTNGFLSLQKQVNNAPSIDLGTAKTVVNFNGGQVELQNAQNVSDNYTSTLAISHREGKFAGFTLATGVGSDGVGGTVNFNDGTTTVITMPVDERYRQYYLMDENGTTTSCLRCPQNTYVYGGSHCMMRACSEPTSKGGAPKNGPTGDALGLYKYPKNPDEGKKGGWSDGVNGLVTPTAGNVPDGYNVNSVTPNNNGTLGNVDDDFLNFWFDPDFEPAAQPEVDQKVSFWKACMTEIAADYAGYGGVIGGDIEIAMNGEVQTELVSNLLYCTIDLDIHEIINDESYSAPVKSPLPSGDPYLYVKPSSVGEQYQHYIANDKDYRIEDKVYYITTATADTWMTFTAPFDVENVYVMETYTEADLVDYSLNIDENERNPRQETKKYQAVHNANFAAFFGVAMVIHPNKTFDMIYNDYIVWAESQGLDVGKYPLIPYKTGNWEDANCYMYKNIADWGLMVEEYEDEDGTYEEYVYDPKWEFLQNGENDPLMEQGETYSILLPYCVGCDDDEDSRQEWDYWSGKFLIFESTKGPHKIKGGEFVGTTISTKELDPNYDKTKEKYLYKFNYGELTDGEGVFAREVEFGNEIVNQIEETESNTNLAVKGNCTFAQMVTDNKKVFVYNGTMNYETFDVLAGEGTILPTTAFLYGPVPVNDEGAPALSISRMGRIKYGSGSGNNNDDTPTGGHVPTIADGSDIFVMGTAAGINIAVSDPQYVGVFSATGALLYSGWVETSVNVNLVVNGVYVVVGENESVKIIY